jgi:hypothetical protein
MLFTGGVARPAYRYNPDELRLARLPYVTAKPPVRILQTGGSQLSLAGCQPVVLVIA